MSIENDILGQSIELGIDNCGIIKPEAMLDYADRLNERIRKVPGGEVNQLFADFADVRKNFPFAKSIVVALFNTGHYNLPKIAQGRIGRTFITDMRFNPQSPENQKITAFDSYLKKLGLKTAFNQHPGITAMRWAAQKAGLGIIRKNNFFYTDKGSWSFICAWITDRDMELIGTQSLPKCPKDCVKCRKACPTGSLSEAYTMNMNTCVCRLTSFGNPPEDENILKMMGQWIYGCDACQDACPMNKGQCPGGIDFPGIDRIVANITPEKIIKMTYNELKENLSKKFFYIKENELWKWKLNTINAMVNGYREDYEELFKIALDDNETIVRNKAAWALKKTLDPLKTKV